MSEAQLALKFLPQLLVTLDRPQLHGLHEGNDAEQALALRESQNDNAPIKCATETCKRKPKLECIHKLCFLCCYGKSEVCNAHFVEKRKREEEDRYIEEGLRSLSKNKKTRFYHYEPKFMKSGETVLIWCFRDFCNNKKWSEDTFNNQLRKSRVSALLQRRSASLNGDALIATSSSYNNVKINAAMYKEGTKSHAQVVKGVHKLMHDNDGRQVHDARFADCVVIDLRASSAVR